MMAMSGMMSPMRLLSCQPTPEEASTRGRGSPRYNHAAAIFKYAFKGTVAWSDLFVRVTHVDR